MRKKRSKLLSSAMHGRRRVERIGKFGFSVATIQKPLVSKIRSLAPTESTNVPVG